MQLLISLIYGFIIMLLYLWVILWFNYKNRKISMGVSFFLAIYHMCYQLLYYYLTDITGGDARLYFDTTKSNSLSSNWIETFGTGTQFVQFILYPFSNENFLNLNYFECYFIYGFLGFLGYMFFYELLIRKYSDLKQYIYLVLLIPGIHYWSVAIGKDSLFFCFICALIFQISKQKSNIFLILILIILITLIRPHIGLIVLLAITITFLLKSEMKIFIKLFIFLIGLLISFFIFQFIVTNIFRFEMANIVEYLDGRQESNPGGSSIDISQYSIAARWFSFLFRPFFFDAKSILWILSSIENSIYAFLVLKVFSKYFFRYLAQANFMIIFNLIYFFTATLLLSYTTSNLGLAIRQKNMVLPSMIIVIFEFIQYKKNFRLNSQKKNIINDG
jgi:hypothetical protein